MKTVILALVFVAAAFCQCGPNATLKPIGGGKQSCVPKSTLIGTDASGNVAISGTLSVGGVSVPTTGAGVVALFSGSCPANTTCVLGSNGVLQTALPFPNANLRGTFLGVGMNNNNSSSGASVMPFGNSFNLFTAACSSGPTQSYWMSPVSGFVRNVSAATKATNGNAVIRVNAIPECAGVTASFTVPTGALMIPPVAAAGGFINSWTANPSNYGHVNEYAPIGLAYARQGGATTAALTAIGAEFVSDDGTADSIFAVAQQSALTASSTQYLGFDAFVGSTEANLMMPIPVAGTLKNLMVGNTGSPTNSVVITLDKNGVNSALTVTIAGGDTSTGNYSDTTHTVSIAAGDAVDIQTVSGASTQTTPEAVTLAFVPTDGTSAILHGGMNAATATTTAAYAQPFSSTTNATESVAEYASPISCNVSHLYVYQIAANGGGVTTTATLYKNGSPTALTGTITSASVGTQGSTGTGSMLVDGTHSVAISQGDRISLQYITGSGTSGAMAAWSAQCN